jgi:hypothetical protein
MSFVLLIGSSISQSIEIEAVAWDKRRTSIDGTELRARRKNGKSPAEGFAGDFRGRNGADQP